MKEGNLVKANDVPILVTINQIEPIYVSFSVPEQQLAELKQYSNTKSLKVDAAPQGTRSISRAGLRLSITQWT